jgi:gluconolactonase
MKGVFGKKFQGKNLEHSNSIIAESLSIGMGVIALFIIFLFAAHTTLADDEAQFPVPVGTSDIVKEGSVFERIYGDGCFTEGVSAGYDGLIYFSDITFTEVCKEGGIQAGVIRRYNPKDGKIEVFRSPSGMSNGLHFDLDGNLIAAEGADFGGRRISKIDMKTGISYILAHSYNGRRFNAPNDIAIDTYGRIYFSDPRYFGHEPLEQPMQCVYRIDPDGSIHVIITDAGAPNGLVISQDGKTLYVSAADTGTLDFYVHEEGQALHKGLMAIFTYDLHKDGSVGKRKTLVNYEGRNTDGPDGMTIDTNGNIYVACWHYDESGPGVYVYSPAGKEIAFFSTGNEYPTNVEFGRFEDKDMLYVTAGGSLFRVRTNARGYFLTK